MTCKNPLHRATEDLHLHRTKGSQFQHKHRKERTRTGGTAHPKGAKEPAPAEEDQDNEEDTGQPLEEVDLTFKVVKEANADGSGTVERLVLSMPDIPHQGQQAAESVGKEIEEVILDPLAPSLS